MFLGRIVDIGAELFAIAASCSYARMLSEGKGRTNAHDLAGNFARQSRRRIDRLFFDLWHNEDAGDYEAARRTMAGSYEWLEEGLIEGWRQAPGEEPVSSREPLPRAV